MVPKVYIIVLNWNGWCDTLECLRSVLRIDYPSFEAVVVDNGSTDKSVELIVAEFPSVKVLETGANLGYTGGNNRGITYALSRGADFILLLNNDTIVDSAILSKFLDATLEFPDAGIFGAKIYYYNDPEKLWFAGGKWQKETMQFVHIGGGEKDGHLFSTARECDYVSGCALFATAESFRSIGLLDNNFFLTYEETDWCYRARAQAYRPLFVPEAKVWHKASTSFGGAGSPLQRYFLSRNRLLWSRNHLPARDRFRLHWKIAMEVRKSVLPKFVWNKQATSIISRFAWSSRTWAITLKRNIRKPENLATFYGIRDYYLNRLGDCPDSVRQLNRVFTGPSGREPH